MIAGGVEAGIHEATMGGFASMKALSDRNDDPEAASRPFDQARDGFVMGEGGGALILEALEHAEARGATPLAELVGYGATADASHITLPAPGGIGAVRAAQRALEKAGMEPAEIDHVNAHATSTPEGDKAELQSIHTIFGDHAPQASRSRPTSRCSATRSARPGAIEAIATILAMRDGLHPADDQPRRPRRVRRGPRPDAQRRHAADGARGDVQLVRLRRPEHGARVPAVGRMSAPTDERPGGGADDRDAASPMARGIAGPVAVGPGDVDDRRAPSPSDAEAGRQRRRRRRLARRPRWPRPTPRCSRSSTG